MASIVNFYNDSQCTTPGQVIIPGVAAITGEKANVSNWTHCAWRGGMEPVSRGDILVIYGSQLAPLEGEVVLSGGTAIYDCTIDQTIPYEDKVETDTATQQTTGLIYNPYFISFDEESESSFVISIYATPSTEQKYNYFNFGLLYYKQTPVDASKNERETWFYNSDYSNSGALRQLLYLFKATSQWDTNMRQIKMYKVNLGDEKDYYLFAFGVTADGKYNDASKSGMLSAGTNFIAVPTDYFKDKEPRPWAGGDSESNEEEAYTPTTPYIDTIPSRDLTGRKNPYGFNNNNGLRIAVITFDQYAEILQGIYSGTAEGLLNKIAQGYYMITGGNDHRQADEIQSIVSAVLCCHLIPRITTYGTTPTVSMATIAGYHIFGQNLHGGVSMEIVPTNGTIFEYDTPLKLIQPRLNSFLDFEPYTSIVLHLPFMASISLSPSALYGNSLYCHYSIDIYTGVLSVDVKVLDKNGRDYIITTQQANIKTEIPIMGNGANGAPLASIASSVLGVARSGSVEMAAAAGIVAGLDEMSKGSTGVAVGKNTIEGIGSYLSPRAAYLVYTRPDPANPASKDYGAGFLEMEGGTSHLSGKVGDFVGYSEFSEIRLDGFSATDDEKQAIEALLKGGVFV